MTMPAPLTALKAMEFRGTSLVVARAAAEGYGRECYDAGVRSATPAWVPFTRELLETLPPDTHCWIRFGSDGATAMAWFRVGTGRFLVLPTSDWAYWHQVTHIAVVQMPGEPA